MRRRASRKGDWAIDFIERRVVIFIFLLSWIVELQTAIQFRAEPRTILTRRFKEAVLLPLTRDSKRTGGIALNGVSAKSRPGVFSPA